VNELDEWDSYREDDMRIREFNTRNNSWKLQKRQESKEVIMS